MENIEIKVSESDANRLEAIHYEMQARRQVLALCIDQGIDPQNETFRRYQEEYISFLAQWEKAKAELERDYLESIPGLRRWSLDWNKRIVTVTAG